MKIITPGIDPKDVAQQATCTRCSAVMEFTPREVERVNDQRGGDFFMFPCPCCGANVTKAVK